MDSITYLEDWMSKKMMPVVILSSRNGDLWLVSDGEI